ncbi:hypothetical protein HPO96_14855 [Kribbella sandramycini]|uniref:Prenyltransferase/squalene oxidase-like repeat protein n=1 Tax=Kribbella sandramycini TaxID=60450 RepID=A0A7Y4P0X8_9ACTN|nr:hypothetical protein [Kribbella sandramycini]MBB6565255.1 hypothetical protein [Kribbella sandramycini]NOL41524.1 hypothetical protein [Kribbella sandramycini]
MDIFSAGREFVRREARLVENRLFATVFEGADAAGVVEALRGYQNADGGFGHGLEPDKRCPDSLGLDVETAFDILLAAGARDAAMVGRAVDWLASVATAEGAVSLASPVIEAYPRAAHMSEWTYEPSLNPTAGLVGRLGKLGVEHPWVELAGAWCAEQLRAGLPTEAHSLHESLEYLEHAGAVDLDQVREWLPKLSYFRADAADPSYGVTPLHLAPTPDSVWAGLFTPADLEAHLDRLIADQQEDGGWAITWEPPGQAATLEYRGIVTVAALRTLKSYGRI